LNFEFDLRKHEGAEKAPWLATVLNTFLKSGPKANVPLLES
jgi:hypothetical protein